jgi:UDP-glucose 4-epimerase
MTLPVLLVTGSCGFLGRYIVRSSMEGRWSTYGVDVVSPENAPLLDGYFQLTLPGIELRRVLEEVQPTHCIHCAGRASIAHSMSEPAPDFETGPVLTFHLLDTLRRHAPACRLVFLSSAAVYGNPERLPVEESQQPAPISPYGFHKWQSEILCREFATVYGLRTSVVRIFSAYGPGLRRQVVWDICRQVLKQGEIKLRGTGNETRDFVHAHDIARGVFAVAETAPMRGEIYNLATGRQTSIRELAQIVAVALSANLQPVFDGNVPPGDPLHWQSDITKLRGLGFSPQIALESGVAAFAEWCKAEVSIL